jgi:hypothetical protein
MNVLVCGGRDFRDQACVDRVLDIVLGNCAAPTLIHGNATGADTLADNWAISRNAQDGTEWCKREVYPADWAQHGNAAGPIRNAEMLKRGEPQLVIAFPGGRGTADMVSKARAAGVLVLQVVPGRMP